MAITIKIKEKNIERVLLKAKKTVEGNIIIADHPEIDILILPEKSKVVALSKEQLDDEVYETQNRLFKFLMRKGVIEHETIQAGNLFMSMEAQISKSKDKEKSPVQFLIYVLSEFIDDEMPFYKDQEHFEKEMEKRLLEPEPDESTEYNPEFHKQQKGTLRPSMRPYGISTVYRI